jgi:hypothetical protein
MRNYIGELLGRGVKASTIAKQAGISVKAVNGYAIGMTRLKSGTKAYEAIRNVSRRTEYEIARKSGMTPAQATKNRRVILRPEALVKTTTRKVKKEPNMIHGKPVERVIDTVPNHEFWQLRLLGRWQEEVEAGNPNPPQIRIVDAYSRTHPKKFPLDDILSEFDEEGWESLTQAGYGYAHHQESAQDALDECIITSRFQLGTSNWILIQILRLEWVHTVVSKD